MGMYFLMRAGEASEIERLAEDADALFEWFEEGVSVNKGWAVMGLLVGEDETALLTLADGPLCEEDFGYGPPLRLEPASVAKLHAALVPLDESAIRTRLLAAAEAGAAPYPYFAGLTERAIDEELEWYVELVQSLRAMTEEAVDAGWSVAAVMT